MSGMPAPNHDAAIAAVRHFNRFYTRQIGALNERLLSSDFKLTEARVLFELAQLAVPTSLTALSEELLIDLGYLSRILKTFEARGLVSRSASPDDGRQVLFSLTDAGRAAFAPLDRSSQLEVEAILCALTPEQSTLLMQSMRTIEHLLTKQRLAEQPIVFRPYQLGDLGWIAHRQAILYNAEYGWDETFEALAAEILAAFVQHHDPDAERGWIAMRDAEILGSVFLVRASDTVAKLRLLYVEPAVRGLGLGRRLVDTCIDFARAAGYRSLMLWTNDVLLPARRIYQAAGFTCVASEPHHSFGADLVGETWELVL